MNPTDPDTGSPRRATPPGPDTIARTSTEPEPSVAALAAAIRAGPIGPGEALATLVERAARLVPSAVRPLMRAVLQGLIEHDPTLVAMQRDLERLIE